PDRTDPRARPVRAAPPRGLWHPDRAVRGPRRGDGPGTSSRSPPSPRLPRGAPRSPGPGAGHRPARAPPCRARRGRHRGLPRSLLSGQPPALRASRIRRHRLPDHPAAGTADVADVANGARRSGHRRARGGSVRGAERLVRRRPASEDAALWQDCRMTTSSLPVPRTLLFIGDSITDCGRREDPDTLGHVFVRLLAEQLTAQEPGTTVVNRGISGHKAADLVA